MEQNEFCIQVKNLCKKFDGKEVLKDLNFNIPKGKISYLVGRSGEGKSVTVKHLIGLHKPDCGEIIINNTPMQNANERTWTELRKKIGTLFQDGALFDSVNIFENVAFPLYNHTSESTEQITPVVKDLLKMVHLSHTENLFSSDLSIGEKKRIGIARALSLKPEIIFYDEPTTNMDPLLSAHIDELILNTQKSIQGLTSLVVSHDIKSMMDVADQIFLLHEGKIYFEGSPDKFQSSDDPLIKQFLDGSLQGPLNVPLV